MKDVPTSPMNAASPKKPGGRVMGAAVELLLNFKNQ
jgi:hypothetical protein